LSLAVKNDIAISVRNLSKAYTIVHDLQKRATLAETILDRLKDPLSRPKKETFWALRDISFQVKKGDVVGIIGRNGAGKSTLLKVLSRITEPTSGEVDIFGRVGSLLEVGTGFHPELTGRENVFLNGAILGMTKGEIRKQFDAIVDFAGVEKFLDTPVKRFSSGMYVRLAFAVAAHLNPEILIVDEVLAVGDAEFQKKCMGKMGEVAKGGRTVLFVSHNMAAIENLCSRAIYLRRGQFVADGETRDIIHTYLASTRAASQGKHELADREDRTGNGSLKLTRFHVESASGTELAAVASGMDVDFVLGYECPKGRLSGSVDVGISLQTEHEQLLFVLYSSYVGKLFSDLPLTGEFRCRIPRFPVSAGSYIVGARVLVGGEEADWPQNGIAQLTVEEGDFWGAGSAGLGKAAPILMAGDWMVDAAEAAHVGDGSVPP
jgi:lipopolysaccharide transport system ATP-binding protein